MYDEDTLQIKPETREEKERNFLNTLTSYFSNAYSFFSQHNIREIHDGLATLNKNIEEAGRSSDRLTGALNKITRWGAYAAWAAVAIATANLVFEVYKYFYGGN